MTARCLNSFWTRHDNAVFISSTFCCKPEHFSSIHLSRKRHAALTKIYRSTTSNGLDNKPMQFSLNIFTEFSVKKIFDIKRAPAASKTHVRDKNHFNECFHFRTDLFGSKCQLDLLTLIAIEFDE